MSAELDPALAGIQRRVRAGIAQLPLSNRTCLVTGATHGLGLAVVRALCARGATVVLLARDAERAAATQASVAADLGVPHERLPFLICNLASQGDIRRVAATALARYPQLHVLVHCAATLNARRTFTEEDVEETLMVNACAPFLLTELLLPALRRGGTAERPARVVAVGCAPLLGKLARGFAWEDPHLWTGYTPPRAYGQAKLALRLWVREAAQRWRAQGEPVTASLVHPGLLNTNLGAQNRGHQWWAAPLRAALASTSLLKPAELGARLVAHVCSAPDAEHTSGLLWQRGEQGSAPQGKPLEDSMLDAQRWRTLAELLTAERQAPVVVSPPLPSAAQKAALVAEALAEARERLEGQ